MGGSDCGVRVPETAHGTLTMLAHTGKTAQVYGSLTHVPCVVRNKWEFPKIRVSYFGVLLIRILLFRVLLLRSRIFGNSQMEGVGVQRYFAQHCPSVRGGCAVRVEAATGRTGSYSVPQKVLSTYMVECRVSILGITIMVWEGIPHNSTLDPLGSKFIQVAGHRGNARIHRCVHG